MALPMSGSGVEDNSKDRTKVTAAYLLDRIDIPESYEDVKDVYCL